MYSFWKNKRVLITGHTGFKGSWLSLWLHQLGAEVYGFSLEPELDDALFYQLGLENKVYHQIGNLCDYDSILKYVSENKFDFVFHLAAQSLVLRSYKNTLDTWNTNVMGTVNLLEALRNYKTNCIVIVITTDKVYHNNEWEQGYVESDQLGGLDPYSASKAGVELAVQSYKSLYEQNSNLITIASARAGNVIGGGDWCENRLVPDIIRSLMVNEIIQIRNPKSIRPWQHVLEPLSGYMQLAKKLSDNKNLASAYNFGPNMNDNCTVEDVVRASLKIWPGEYFENFDDEAPHEAGLLKLSIDKAQDDLNWEPKWDFFETINITVGWYKKVFEGASPLSVTLEDIKSFEIS